MLKSQFQYVVWSVQEGYKKNRRKCFADFSVGWLQIMACTLKPYAEGVDNSQYTEVDTDTKCKVITSWLPGATH